MKKFFKKIAKSFHSGQTGFTLIELLIVIVILGVLAAAIIPNLSKFVGSGKVGAANAELATVRTAVAAFQADNDGNIPAATVTGLPVTSPQVASSVGPTATWIQTYVSASKAIKGTYAIAIGGAVTGTTHPDATWDLTNDKWK